jgi:hypothetical protein
MSDSMQSHELAYKGDMQLTGETSFGVDFQSVLNGTKTIPPEGLRFDFPFNGTLSEGKIKGKLQGTDYLHVRGDGISHVHAHAVVTTEDGEHISYFEEGISIPDPETATAEVKANATLHSNSEKYAWVNRNRFWVTAKVYFQTGQVTFTGYTA